MPDSLVQRSAPFAVLSLIALAGLLIAATGLAWWLLSAPDLDTWRDQFPPEVALGETICQASERGGLLEASSIAIFALDPDIVERMKQGVLPVLGSETPPPNDREWIWTPWIQVGSGDDMLKPGDGASTENLASRARRFVMLADRFTNNRCVATINGLDWSGAVVRFEHPVDWSVEQCDDSCLAQVLLPSSGLAIAATYD